MNRRERSGTIQARKNSSRDASRAQSTISRTPGRCLDNYEYPRDGHHASSVSPHPPRQPLQPSGAFRLTPGDAWSTDTLFYTPRSVVGVEVPTYALPGHRPVLSRAHRGRPCAACTFSTRTVRAPACVRRGGVPSPRSASGVAANYCLEGPSAITAARP